MIPFRVDDIELRAIDGKARQLRMDRSELIREAVMRLVGGSGTLSGGRGGRAR